MRRAIPSLEQLSDIALYERLSEGMPLIVKNATNFDETACRLHRDGEIRASEIIRGFAEEEAAKVLVLIDYVRCPRNWERRAQVLKRFYGHVAKRIHAMACDFPNIESFAELSKLVEMESQPFYLDGPNQVDWIFPNSISAERERFLYVDYVRDMTDEEGTCYWINPSSQNRPLTQYRNSDCVKLVDFLYKAGALSTGGLAEIAEVWRGFAPEPDTDRGELHNLIFETLNRLASRSGAIEEEAKRFIISHWPFPLWSLTIKEPRSDDGYLNDLREERKRTVRRIEESETKRDPPPAITRAVVEDISKAYMAWKSDMEAHAARSDGSIGKGIRFLLHTDIRRDLASYACVKGKLALLSDAERAALVALGWFVREQTVDWPATYTHAIKTTPTLDEDTQIGLGRYWLAGLDRWESKPTPFSAGRRHRLDTHKSEKVARPDDPSLRS